MVFFFSLVTFASTPKSSLNLYTPTKLKRLLGSPVRSLYWPSAFTDRKFSVNSLGLRVLTCTVPPIPPSVSRASEPLITSSERMSSDAMARKSTPRSPPNPWADTLLTSTRSKPGSTPRILIDAPSPKSRSS